MKPIICCIHIAAPRERVFEISADIQSWPRFVRAIDAVEVLTEHPLGVGTRFRETRTMMGKRATEEMVITAFEPPHSWTTEARSHGMHYVTISNFTDDAGGTRIDMIFQGTPQKLLGKVFGACLGWVFAGHLKKCLENDLADIKSHCEQAATAT